MNKKIVVSSEIVDKFKKRGLPDIEIVELHTPVPWHQHDMEQGVICTEGGLPIVDCNAKSLPSREIKANVNLVLRSVNNHKNLVDICKKQHDAIDLLFSLLIEKDKTFFPSKCGDPWKTFLMANHVLNEVVK